MAINEATTPRRHKKDRSSIGSKTGDRHRSSIGGGSKPLSFTQKKGRFAGGGAFGGPNHKSERLRKDTLDDFARATHTRSQSVHQMAAMFASATAKVALPATPTAGGSVSPQRRDLDALVPGAVVSGSKIGKGLSGLVSVFPHGRVGSDRTLESMVLEAQGQPEAHSAAAKGGLEVTGYSAASPPPVQSISESTSPSSTLGNTSGIRARDLKKIHLNEALDVTRHRVGNVKDLASVFRGESRPENVEVFHKRHKEQEAEYRHKVEQGKETLKKTSQGTDAMYNFVLKLNLATREGKERFMRKWAIGRIANGESVSPSEGWKFLQSLGIDVPKASSPKIRKPSADEDKAPPAIPAAAAAVDIGSGEGQQTATTPAPPSRGRRHTRNTSVTYGGAGGACGTKQHEAAAWELAMSQAVGAVVRVNADARAPKLAFHRRRRSGSEPRRSPGNMPRAPDTCRAQRTKSFFFSSGSGGSCASDNAAAAAGAGAFIDAPVDPFGNMPQAPQTCRGPRTKSFFSSGIGGFDDTVAAVAAPPPPLLPLPRSASGLPECGDEEAEEQQGGEAGEDEFCGIGSNGFAERLSVSPAGSNVDGLDLTMGLWRQEAREGRPQSQAFCTRGASLDSVRASVSSRLSGCTDTSLMKCSGGGGVRLSLSPRRNSPGRFDLSPTRLSDGRSPLTPTEAADRNAAAALSAKVSWDCPGSSPALGSLQLPQRLFEEDDDGGDAEGSEERFGGQPMSGFGAGGEAETKSEVPYPHGGGGFDWDEVAEGDGADGCVGEGDGDGDDDGGSGRAAAVATLDTSFEVEGALQLSAAGLDDCKARAQRLSMVSVDGPGTLSDEEEEEEKQAEAERDFAVDDAGEEHSDPVPAVAVLDHDPLFSVRQNGVSLPPPVGGTRASDAAAVVGVTSEDASRASHEDCDLMDEIARVDEASALLEERSDLTVMKVDGDGDADEGEVGGDDGDCGLTPGAVQNEEEIESSGDDTGGGGTSLSDINTRSSLDHNWYAPGVGTLASPAVGVMDGDSATEAAVAAGFVEVEARDEEKLGDRSDAAGGETVVVAQVMLPDADSDEISDGSDSGSDASESGFMPSVEEETNEGPEDGPLTQEAAAAIDAAVRDTLNNLIAGVAILVGGDEMLACSEVLSELQSDAGDGDEAAEEVSRGRDGRVDDGQEETDGRPSPTHEEVAEAGLHNKANLRIAVGSEMQDEEPPVPRLHWGVNSIVMDSPLTPSRYNGVDGEPSTCSLSPCRLNFTGLLQEPEVEGGSTEPLVKSLTIKVEECDDAADSECALIREARVSAPWHGTPKALMSPLSPFSVDSSPDVLEASELSKPPDRWGGRLSVLSEGCESQSSCGRRASGGRSSSAAMAIAKGGDGYSKDDGAATLDEERRLTEGTEQTASPLSQRVSSESLPPAAGATAGCDPAAAKRAVFSACNGDGDGDGNDELLRSKEGEATALADASRREEDGKGSLAAPMAAVEQSAAGPNHAAAMGSPEADVGLPMPATPAGSPGGKPSVSSPLGGADVANDGNLFGVAGEERGEVDDGGDGGDGRALTLVNEEAQDALLLDTPNPYEDFDELYDRDHFSAVPIELECKTPAGIFNFCRPRSATVYTSATGAGPGFFAEDGDGSASGAVSPRRTPSDARQGCMIS